MNLLLERFPELLRYSRLVAKPGRLAFGAALSIVLGFSLWLMAIVRSSPGEALLNYVLWCQALVLLGYGSAQTASAILAERQEGTWELQRLTPRAGWELAAGTLLGAPLYAYFLAACLVPWNFVALAMDGGSAALLLRGWLALAAMSLLTLSIGLAVSAYCSEEVGGSSSTGVLVGLLGVQGFAPIMAMADSKSAVAFAGISCHPFAVGIATAASLAFWAFLAAKWRIGKDLLEGPRAWRLPAFLGFVVAYLWGWGMHKEPASMLAPALIVYMAAVLNRSRLDHWRRWLQAPGDQDRIPVWVSGWAAFTVLAVGAALWAPAEKGAELRLYPLMQSAFLLRDLAFLQWCRFRDYKRPEVVALISLAVAYALPGFVSGVWQAASLTMLYAPVPSAEGLVNLLPGALQAAAAVWYLRRDLAARPALRPARAV